MIMQTDPTARHSPIGSFQRKCYLAPAAASTGPIWQLAGLRSQDSSHGGVDPPPPMTSSASCDPATCWSVPSPRRFGRCCSRRSGRWSPDTGGILSHPAIIAREHRVPAVVATGNATALLHDDQIVTIDGTAGQVQLVR